MSTPEITNIAVLSAKKVGEITGLSGPTIWRLRRAGNFPEPIRLSPGRKGWLSTDIEQWIGSRAR